MELEFDVSEYFHDFYGYNTSAALVFDAEAHADRFIDYGQGPDTQMYGVNISDPCIFITNHEGTDVCEIKLEPDDIWEYLDLDDVLKEIAQ